MTNNDFLKVLILSCVFFGLFSCQEEISESVKTIVLSTADEVPAFSASELQSTVEIIDLEVNENSVFTTDLHIASNNKMILIAAMGNLNNFTLLAFNIDGSFIGQVGKMGNGPGEYIELTGIDLSANGEYIYLLDRFKQQILIYSSDFSFVKGIEVPGRPLTMQVTEQSDVLLAYQKPLLYENLRILRYSLSGNNSHVPLLLDPVTEEWQGGPAHRGLVIYPLENGYRFWEMDNDSLYNISTSNQVSAEMNIDLGESGLSIKKRQTGFEMKDLQGKTFTTGINELGSNLLIEALSWEEKGMNSSYYIFNKQTNKLLVSRPDSDELPLWEYEGGEIRFWPNYRINNQTICGISEVGTDDVKLIFIHKK